MKLKPIDEQVVALVGASSGIGREAAIAFADRGAKVVVAARGGRSTTWPGRSGTAAARAARRLLGRGDPG